MKKYNANIENGFKSAFFTLKDLKENEKISNDDLTLVIKKLEGLIEDSQNGNIFNKGSDLNG